MHEIINEIVRLSNMLRTKKINLTPDERTHLISEVDALCRLIDPDQAARADVRDALRLSEEKFSKAFDASPDALVISMVNTGVVIDVNKSFEKLLGHSRDEVIGRTTVDLNIYANPDDREHVIRELQRLGYLRNYEVRIRTRTGEIRTTHFSTEKISFGQENYMLTIIHDVSELKIAEARLRASEQRFRQLADSMPQLVWTANPDGTVDYYNQRYIEYGGISPQPGEVWEWGPVLQDEDLLPTMAAWQHSVETGDIYQIEHRVHMADGSLRWVLSRGVPARDEQGNIVKWYGTATDIHATKMAQDALRASEDRMRALAEAAQQSLVKLEAVIDNMNEAVILVDLEGTMTRINPAAIRLHGFTNEADMRARMETYVDHYTLSVGDGQVLPPVEWPVSRALRGERVTNKEISVRSHETGQSFTGLFNAAPVDDGHGNPMLVVVTIVDISYLREMERQASDSAARLEVQQRLTEQREQERLRIAREIHDGPVQDLLAVNYLLRAIQVRFEDEELTNQIDEVRELVDHQVVSLRDYATELRPPILYNFGLARAIKSHLAGFSKRHPDVSIDLAHESLNDPLPGDTRLALFRIYQEALTNAIKHARATQIRVRLAEEDGCYRLEVCDNGAGFSLPKDELRLVRGGHLGIVGMRERAQAIGAKLEVESRQGQGTCVRVRVALSPAGETPAS